MLTVQTRLPVTRPRPASLNPFASGLWHRLRAAHETWQKERDLRAIEGALNGLTRRQLAMIGMSHETLASDLCCLIDRAETERQITDEILRIVDDKPPRAFFPRLAA